MPFGPRKAVSEEQRGALAVFGRGALGEPASWDPCVPPWRGGRQERDDASGAAGGQEMASLTVALRQRASAATVYKRPAKVLIVDDFLSDAEVVAATDQLQTHKDQVGRGRGEGLVCADWARGKMGALLRRSLLNTPSPSTQSPQCSLIERVLTRANQIGQANFEDKVRRLGVTRIYSALPLIDSGHARHTLHSHPRSHQFMIDMPAAVADRLRQKLDRFLNVPPTDGAREDSAVAGTHRLRPHRGACRRSVGDGRPGGERSQVAGSRL